MTEFLRHPFRGFFRLLGVTAIFSVAFLRFVFLLWLPNAGRVSIKPRAIWVSETSRRILKFLQIEVTHSGNPPDNGLLVCNHLSYLDILVLASIQPFVFVSKDSVKYWPGIGILTMCGGTIFVNREKRTDVKRVNAQFFPVIESGNVVVLFPEGTSSDGHQVLPFKSSLLGPAAEHEWPVTASHLHYSMNGGNVETEVCYWGDSTFATHFLNLITKDQIRCSIRFSATPMSDSNRKQLSARLHEEVIKLSESNE